MYKQSSAGGSASIRFDQDVLYILSTASDFGTSISGSDVGSHPIRVFSLPAGSLDDG